MPPGVPTRPAPAANIDEVWGQWVHDWLKKRDVVNGTTGSQTITNVEADITGMTMTLGSGWFFIGIAADLDVATTGVGILSVRLSVDGVIQTPEIQYSSGAGVGRASCFMAWLVNIAGAGVVKARVIKSINAGTASVLRQHSAIMVL